MTKTMRILITGFSAKQVAGKMMRTYVSNSDLAAQALRLAGHEVEHRSVEIGEDLSRFDRVVAYLASLDSLSSTHKYGTLWALAHRPDAVVAFNDWQTIPAMLAFFNPNANSRLWKAMRNEKKTGPKCIKAHKVALQSRDGARECRRIEAMLTRVVKERRLPWPAVLPMFEWGDHGLTRVICKELRSWNPTSLVDLKQIASDAGAPAEKSRCWVHATLTAPKKALLKMGLTLGKAPRRWRVEQYGPHGQANLDEPDLLKIQATRRGMIVFPHKHAGSGWWRIRMLYAGALGCVMALPKADRTSMINARLLDVEPEDIEQMSDADLDVHASCQLKAITHGSPKRAETIDQCSRAFTGKGARS